ncbi:uncharacterized protein LOC132256464 [Phlebotomus argentipes]|uniref:uncharacterized protein LOC132256464 n=1 Tax=Phlebotomus argentipes TaxID=94469 RepID=UPI0028933A16|nr:uncharacterized protein LOC132256464 [Phlebotomus argentipes]
MAQNSVASPPMSPLSPQSPAGPSPSTSGATLSPNQLKLQALRQRKADLEKKLSERNSQLQEICRKEAQLIGIYPVAIDGQQTSATLPRKIGTSFKLSEILINNKEDDVNNLLLQKQLQQQICKASQKLMSDTSQPKSVRRTHKSNYEAAHQKLLAINHTLAVIKRRQYQQHAEESPAMRRNSVGSANTRSKTASINSDSSGNINGSEGALNEASVYHHLHHSPTKSVASFPGAGVGLHGNRKHSNTAQFYPTFQGLVTPVDPHDFYYNNHHIKHRSAILLQQQQQQQQNLHLLYPEEPQIFLQPPDLFCDQYVEPVRPPTSYQHHMMPQPDFESVMGATGLGGYWAINENNEKVWCSMERFSSLDRNKQQNRMAKITHNVTPTKSTSLGNFDFLTKHDGDNMSLSSLNSEKKQQLREKVWCETSLDSVVLKPKAHTRPVPPIPVEERSKENIYQNHSEIAAALERSLSQAPFDHRPPPLPPTSSTLARTGVQRTGSSLSSKAAEIRIESPKNVTVVQQAKFMPYKEVTKPFEMSDFYKYSTKFRQKVMLGEVNAVAEPSGSATDAQGIQKSVYQPPNPSICHPISYQ